MPRLRKGDIGTRIAVWREHLNLLQTDVAQRAGMNVGYLSRVESGKVNPTVYTASRIAEAMGMSLEDLLRLPKSVHIGDKSCPVSVTGSCVLELLRAGSNRGRVAHSESYSPAQLRLVRQFMVLLQQSDRDLQRVLKRLIGEFLKAQSEEPEASL